MSLRVVVFYMLLRLLESPSLDGREKGRLIKGESCGRRDRPYDTQRPQQFSVGGHSVPLDCALGRHEACPYDLKIQGQPRVSRDPPYKYSG